MDERLRRIIEARVVYTLPDMESADVVDDLAYRGEDGPRMTVYRPPGASKPCPAVVFVHGGPLPPGMTPSPGFSPRTWGTFVSYGQLAAASGLVGVTFDHRYRGLDADAFALSAGDVRAAAAYVRENVAELGIDGDRLALWLFSGAGPHLSLALDGDLGPLSCLVAFYPVLDFKTFEAMGYPPAAPEVVAAHTPAARLATARGVPPLLLGRAGQDHPAANEALGGFLNTALEAGVAVELLNHPEGIHGFDVMTDDARSREIVARALAFVTEHTKK